MKKKTIWNFAALALLFLGGMIGGIISDQFQRRMANASQSGNNITANNFMIIDKAGRLRCGIGLDVDGHPLFYLNDDQGVNRCYLGLSSKGPTLVLKNSNGTTVMFLDYTEKDGATIGINNDKNEPELILNSSIEGRRSITMYDKDGKGRLGIAVVDGVPGIAMLDSNKSIQISMQARDGKGSLISLHDQGGDPQIALGLKDGKSFMYAFDKDGSGVFGGGQPGKGPALVLKERGKITWAAGSSGVASDVRELERGIDRDAMTKDWLR